jgi:hypothetical protein
MTALLSSISARVHSNLPACPQPVIEQYLLLAAVELCRKAYVWTEEVTVADVVADDLPIAITLAGDGTVIKVLSIEVDTLPIMERSLDYIKANIIDWRTVTGIPVDFIEEDSGTITLVPAPSVAAQVVIKVAVEPEDEATAFPATILSKHRETLVSGAISMLCLIPNMPWSSMEFASLHKMLFDEGVQKAKRQFNFHHVLPSLVTSPQPI